MAELILVVVAGILGGVAVGLQTPIAGAMSQRVGGAASSFIIHVSGAVFSLALLAARGGEQIANWRALTWYMWGAGLFGVALYLTLSLTFPRVGATAALVLIIVGQLVTGVVVDHFGWLGVVPRSADVGRLVGLVVLLVGAYLILR